MSESVNRRISIFIDAVQAEAQLKKLEERERSLIKANSEIKQGSAAWKANATEIEKVQKQIGFLNDQLSGKVGVTMGQLKKQQAQLNQELDKMPISLRKSSEEWAKLQKVQTMIAVVRKETQGTAAAWQQFTSQIKAGAVGVLGGNLATALVGGTFSYVQQGIANAAKVSDQLADVRKTTGLTTEEVTNLNSALGKIDTRTATSELRNMAVVAGQFGIPKEQILGFIKAVDMVNIALGDEFGGGAEAIATEMSKLRNVFADIKTDDIGLDIKHISNALNELGAAGVATGPVVADFANRIGGVGIPLGLTTGQVLGLSATLQELNVSTERGGTAVTKILQKMLTNTKDFAAIAGEDITSFEEKLNTDLMGAFVSVMEGAAKTGKSSTVLAGIIKELELSGAGASEVFSKLGGNTQLLRERMDLANKSIIDTNSITDEASIKQDNLAGSIARLDKAWSKLTNSGGAQTFWKMMVDGAAGAVKALGNFWNYLSGPSGTLQMVIDDTAEKVQAEIEKQAEIAKATAYKQKELRKQELQKLSNEELAIEKQKIAAKQKLAFEAAQIQLNNGDKKGFADQNKVFNEAKMELELIAAITQKRREQSSVVKKLTDEEVKDLASKQKKQEAYLEQFVKFQEEVTLVSNQAEAAQEGKDESEIEKVNSKYTKLLAKAQEHFKKLPSIAAEYYETVKILNDAEYRDKVAIYDKQIAAAEKAFDSETAAFIKAEKAKTKAKNEEWQERINLEYKNLIGSKSARLISGKTDGTLTPEEELEKKKEILLLETQAHLENDKLQAGEREAIWAQYYANVKALDDSFNNSQLQNAFEFARQFQGLMTSLASIENNKATEKLNQEQLVTKAQLTEVDKRKNGELKSLEDKKKQGLITEEQYSAAKTSIDEKYTQQAEAIQQSFEEKKIQSARESAERQKALATFDAIISTASAIISMLADPGGFAGVALSIGAGITGAAQIAAIQSTPVPQFNTGGSTLDVLGQNTGKRYRANHIGTFKGGGKYTSASYGIIGEEGAELVVPNWLYTHPKMFDTMNFLEYSISKGKAFASGGNTIGAKGVEYVSNSTDPLLAQLMHQNNQLLVQNNQLQAAILQRMQNPIPAVITYDQLTESNERMNEIQQMSGL